MWVQVGLWVGVGACMQVCFICACEHVQGQHRAAGKGPGARHLWVWVWMLVYACGCVHVGVC